VKISLLSLARRGVFEDVEAAFYWVFSVREARPSRNGVSERG